MADRAYGQGQIVLPDKAVNPIRVKPPEGQMMAIMRGNKDGPLDRIVASVSGWHFKYQEDGFVSRNEWDKWELVEDFNASGNRVYIPNPSMPEEEFGIIVVGFLRALHIPHIRYVKWELKPGETSPSLVSKDRKDSPFFYFQYPMGIEVVEVESVDNFEITITMNVVVRLVNPYRAQFLAGGWESLLDAAVQGAVREHLSGLDVDKIRAEKESGGLTTRIKRLNEDISGEEGFKKKFGVEVLDVRFVGFKVEGDEEIEKALQARGVNRLMADAAVEKGREIRTIAQAQADAERIMAGAAEVSAKAYGSGEVAGAVRQYELLKEALIGTNASVVSLGGNNPIAITPPAKK